ncbi:molecular chaperone HscC [Asaia sp. W19]|uniref:Hsp70 family protein n=1 Tax=unclassified Asaia TaxID=2685023 RepID=UPI000F8F7298|nr:Hsp70 family protein [Asaia sp. W19]RUT26196.1 molecular chaperone HscC [Asaia sp. W19]
MTCIGIDLGTSNSVAAYLEDGIPKLIPNALGDTLTPSAVSIAEDGTILIGKPAIDRLITHPDRSTAGFKRLMGTNTTVTIAKREFRPEELSALVLKSLKQDAEALLGVPVGQAIISVPAYFAEPQRRATLAAARLAGLEALRLVNEPTAAALAYGLESRREGHFLVLDLGGGTFDVSLLNKFEGVMEIRASSGDSSLGGNDFRDLIASLFLADQKVEASRLSPYDYAQMLSSAEAIKQGLTNSDCATSKVALESGPVEWSLTRERFEEAAAGLIARLRAPITRVINDASISAAEIDEIVLVGGASRMPLVLGLVTRLFHRFPLAHGRPDHLIGLGAAVQVGLAQRDAALEDVMMTDVCPFSLGVACLDGTSGEMIMSVIIERNTIIPVSHKSYYHPVVDGQKALLFRVLQGENIRPDMNVELGTLQITLPPGSTTFDNIETRFTYDVSGALEVEILVTRSGETAREIFTGQSGLSEEEVESRFASLQELKLAPRDQAVNRALIARAERLFAECVGWQRDQVLEQLSMFHARLKTLSVKDLTGLRESFSAWLDDFEKNLRF